MMSDEERAIFKAKREGYRVGIYNFTALSKEQIEEHVNETYPFPKIRRPKVYILSTGTLYRVTTEGVVQYSLQAGTDWYNTSMTLDDLRMFGKMAEYPFEEVTDE